jgi:hypothetical protein
LFKVISAPVTTHVSVAALENIFHAKKLYTLEGKLLSAFICLVVGEGLSTLPDFVQKSPRE